MARNAGLLTVAKAGTMGLNFVAWAYLFRALGTEPAGQIGVGLALVSYFVLLVALGIDAVGMRELARTPDRLRDLVADVVGLRAALCAVAVVAYLVVVWALPRPLTYRMVLSALALQIVARAFQLDWAFLALERVGAVAARELAAAATLLAGVAVLVRDPADVVWAAFLVAAAPLVSTVGLWAGYLRENGRPRLRPQSAAWKAILLPALPLAASALMIEIYTSLDRLMLDALRTTAEVGLYTAAYKVFSLAVVPTAVLYPVFFPTLASALGDREAMRKRGRTFGRALLAFGLPIAVAGPFLAGPAVVLVSGPDFAAAGPALALLFLNAGVIHMNAALGTPLMAWDLQTPYMWTVIAGAVVNVALNVVLIPPFGIEGAATATVASEAVVGLALAATYWRTTGTLPFAGAWRVMIAAVLGAGFPAWAATSAGWPVLLAAVTVILSYAAAAWAFGVVDRTWALDTLRRRNTSPPNGP